MIVRACTCVGISLAVLISANASANELSVGLGGIYHISPYADYTKDFSAIPFAHYESDKIYFRETSLGYIISHDDKNEFSATLSYLPYEFKPGDSDKKSLQQLDKRETTALAGMSYYRHEKWGTIKLSFSGDILDKSNGFIGEASWMHAIKMGKLSIIPSAGITWYSNSFTQYYYGISGHESHDSGLKKYQPEDSWNPFLGLSVSYKLLPQLTLLSSARYTMLDDQIKNSPMVDSAYDFSLFTGVSWSF